MCQARQAKVRNATVFLQERNTMYGDISRRACEKSEVTQLSIRTASAVLLFGLECQA